METASSTKNNEVIVLRIIFLIKGDKCNKIVYTKHVFSAFFY